jgi:hypothetical protein
MLRSIILFLLDGLSSLKFLLEPDNLSIEDFQGHLEVVKAELDSHDVVVE